MDEKKKLEYVVIKGSDNIPAEQIDKLMHKENTIVSFVCDENLTPEEEQEVYSMLRDTDSSNDKYQDVEPLSIEEQADLLQKVVYAKLNNGYDVDIAQEDKSKKRLSWEEMEKELRNTEIRSLILDLLFASDGFDMETISDKINPYFQNLSNDAGIFITCYKNFTTLQVHFK